MKCNFCPRNCNAEREENYGQGYCKMPSLPKLARAGLHFWEEPCISGKNGSGTVFFSGCNLRCVYCQNLEISHNNKGKTVSVERLAEIFKELEDKGAHNINLVNPSHYIEAIKSAFEIYRPKIPVVYNSSGYDSIEAINKIIDYIDVFLVDIKYLSSERSLKYSNCSDYPDVTTKFVKFLTSKVFTENLFDNNGIMQKGVIVRHLILPQGTNEAIKVIDWVNENCNWITLSIMSQYVPFGNLDNYKELNRKITKREHQKILDYIDGNEIKIKNIFTQELSSSSAEFIPEFDLSGI